MPSLRKASKSLRKKIEKHISSPSKRPNRRNRPSHDPTSSTKSFDETEIYQTLFPVENEPYPLEQENSTKSDNSNGSIDENASTKHVPIIKSASKTDLKELNRMRKLRSSSTVLQSIENTKSKCLKRRLDSTQDCSMALSEPIPCKRNLTRESVSLDLEDSSIKKKISDEAETASIISTDSCFKRDDSIRRSLKERLSKMASFGSLFTSPKNNKTIKRCSSLKQDDTPPAKAKIKKYVQLPTPLWLESVADFNGDIKQLMTSQEIKRQEAIFELFSGEKDLVEDLTLIKEVYLNPISKLNLLSEDELDVIFGSITDLLSIHQDLFEKLKETRNKDGSVDEIGEILIEWIPSLMPYVSYCAKQLKRKDILDNKTKQDTAFADFLQRCLDSPFSRKLDLWSFLDAPRCRLVKYPLLFSAIEKVTFESHRDKALLHEAVKGIEEIISEADKETGQAKCNFIKEKLYFVNEEHSSLVESARKVICDGSLRNRNGTFEYLKDLRRDCLENEAIVKQRLVKCLRDVQQPINSDQATATKTPSKGMSRNWTALSNTQIINLKLFDESHSFAKLQAFLFDTVFVLTRPATRRGAPMYQVSIEPMALSDMQFEDLQDGEVRRSNSFKNSMSKNSSDKYLIRVSTKDSDHPRFYSLQAHDDHDKKQWMNSFKTLLTSERTESAPNYESLHEQLSIKETLNKINARNALKLSAPIVAKVGKVFRHSLDKLTPMNKGDNHVKIHVSKLKNENLPDWLFYNSHSNKLVGIPTKDDVGVVDIVLKTSFKGLIKTTKFQLEVRDTKHQSFCHDGNPSLTAAAILDGDIKNFKGKMRMQLMRKFADYIDVEMHELNMAERKNDGSFDSSVITAGPGDRMPRKRQQGIVFTWSVACGLGIPGDITVNKLKLSSGNNHIYERVGLSFVGWYVFKTQYRFRRQLFPAATPVATPVPSVPTPKSVTSVISGTPVISPTPSMVVKKTSSIAKTTTDVIKPTPIPVTKAPTTKQPTTEPLTTTEKPKTTTPKPETTTMEPETTTMKPETTTMKPKTTTMEPEITTMKPETTTMKPKTTTMKPETTTMEPETTTMEPEITTPKVTKMKPEKKSTKKPMTVVSTSQDGKPILINPIDLIVLKVGQAYKLKIKRDMFEDDIDGDTYSLTLSLKRIVSGKLSSADMTWIYLDTVGKALYVLPTLVHANKEHAIVLQATDSSGNQENAVFRVKVMEETVVDNHIFNVTIDADFNAFMSNAKNKVELIESIATATAVGYQKLRIQRFYPGSVVTSFALEELRGDGSVCNSVDAQQYKAKLGGAEFKDKMAPKYIVVKTSAKNVSPVCAGARKTPIDNTKPAGSSYKWWEIVLIPVIVIAVLLLVIGLIFFFLCRRKRYEPPKEDKNTLLYQKKPIIMREEYDEKPEVMSLQPLVLPNEKAPVSNNACQPRTSTPDGNGSSSISTEGDDKALIDKSTPPHSPPRSPLYGRSPPPYNESHKSEMA
eukprot:gene7004-7789_t